MTQFVVHGASCVIVSCYCARELAEQLEQARAQNRADRAAADGAERLAAEKIAAKEVEAQTLQVGMPSVCVLHAPLVVFTIAWLLFAHAVPCGCFVVGTCPVFDSPAQQVAHSAYAT